jgi:ubiquinone/menaquinone biosynthesis C-methylase UbiE
MSTVSYRDFTNTGAENYARDFVPAIATPVSAGLLAAADLRSGERVLDVACGTGVIARLAAAAVGPTGTVAAIDVAPDMIDVARATPAPSGAAIDWHVGDAISLPFEDDAYDAVVCQMGLMFMSDRPGAVAEMRRVLAPGGRLVVNTPGSIQPPFEVLERAIVDNISPDLAAFVRAVFSMHDPDEVATLLREAGLRDVTANVTPVALRLPAPAEFLWQYINLTPMGPIVAQAPDRARAAMERQAVAAWEPYVVAGRIKAEQPMLVAHGRK